MHYYKRHLRFLKMVINFTLETHSAFYIVYQLKQEKFYGHTLMKDLLKAPYFLVTVMFYIVQAAKQFL